MFNIFEKIRFILSTRLHRRKRKLNRKKKEDKYWVQLIIRTTRALLTGLGIIFLLGLLIYYFTPPSIHITDSYDKLIYTDESPYMIKGYLSSGNKSTLRLNGKDVDLIGSDFTVEVRLHEGDNRFVFEASNVHGTTKEIHVIHLDTKKKNG